MPGDVGDVEAGAARGELDDLLLALLLLRHLLGADLDAGQLRELGLMLLQEIGARVLGEQDLDVLALELAPIEIGLRERPPAEPGGGGGERGGGGAGLQEFAAIQAGAWVGAAVAGHPNVSLMAG